MERNDILAAGGDMSGTARGSLRRWKVPVTVGIHFNGNLGKNLGTGRKDSIPIFDGWDSADRIGRKFPAELVAGKTDFCWFCGYGTDPGYGNIQGSIFYIAKRTLKWKTCMWAARRYVQNRRNDPWYGACGADFSYRDYPYMKKRWEKFCRHSAIAGTETLKWEKEMECFHHFLGDMWEAVCRDEVFFGDWMPELARFLG